MPGVGNDIGFWRHFGPCLRLQAYLAPLLRRVLSDHHNADS
jgi:hypothetical protein